MEADVGAPMRPNVLDMQALGQTKEGYIKDGKLHLVSKCNKVTEYQTVIVRILYIKRDQLERGSDQGRYQTINLLKTILLYGVVQYILPERRSHHPFTKCIQCCSIHDKSGLLFKDLATALNFSP